MKTRCILLLLLVTATYAWSQDIQLKGIVMGSDGAALPSSFVNVPASSKVAVTDENGIFSIRLSRGNHVFEISHISYKTISQSLRLEHDTLVYFILESSAAQLEEVVVNGNRVLQSDRFETTQMSTYDLTGDDISSVPVLGGEADLIKVIQLLPGVSKGVEGSTDLFVRGGAADQNLVLLDGATVYNTGHLFGFLSVFNPDIIQDVEYINGAFPAEHGGRLSSILNVRTKSGISSRTHVQGNIGLLASRLMIRQPLVKDKLDIWLAGRRTYADLVAQAAGIELPYYFYDFNGKLTYRPTQRDLVRIGFYSGQDILNYTDERDSVTRNINSNFTISNNSLTLQWQRQLSSNIYSTLDLHRTEFNYDIKNNWGEANQALVNSAIQDAGGKLVLHMDSLGKFSAKAGLDIIYHQLRPSVINTTGILSEILESSSTNSKSSLEASAFLQFDGTFGQRWKWSTGIRFSTATVSNTLFTNPEPRLAIRYELNNSTALKASYSRMSQYIHRVSSSAISFPTDIWYPVTPNIRPQTANQFALGIQKKLPRDFFISLEGYYKTMQNLIAYREGANLFLNADFEDLLAQGDGRSKGLELLIKKESGKFNGWISYTLSKSEQQFNILNNGEWYPSRYDRRHNASVVLNYELSKRLSVSAVFEFISGSRFTPVIGQYAIPATTQVGVQLIPVFAPLNSVKLADSHRLDLGVKYRTRMNKRIQGEWFVGVYNAYNRATPYGITIEQNENGGFDYQQPGFLGLLPFISYGFKF